MYRTASLLPNRKRVPNRDPVFFHFRATTVPIRERKRADRFEEAFAAGISHAELMSEIARQRAVVRDVAPTLGQKELAL